MADPVKISELPSISVVLPDYILPVVDSGLTQTSKATAAQIAAVGGGPPGDNTVTAAKISTGAVTAEKIGFTGPDKLISRIAGGAGGGVEIPCSSFARSLLAATDGAQARLVLDAIQSSSSPSFSGQVRLAVGSVGAPSLVSVNDLKTGLYFPNTGALAFASNGLQTWRLEEDGTLFTNAYQPEDVNSGDSVPIGALLPSYGLRAFAAFNGNAQGSNLEVIIGPSARAVGQFFGRTTTTTSIRDDAATRAAMVGLADASGYNLSFPGLGTSPVSPSFVDSLGRGTFPLYNRGTERRANYTSPGDDRHWYWSGTYPSGSWQLTSKNVTGQWWIGYISLTSKSATAAQPILSSAGIRSVVRNSTGQYTINFASTMPDANYGVIGTSGGANLFVRVASRGTDSCVVQTYNTSNTLTDSSSISIGIVR